MRRCNRCERDLPADADHFYRLPNGGLRGPCKDCNRTARAGKGYAKTKAWRQKNWNKTLEQNKRWRKNNPEKQRAVSRRQKLKAAGWTLEEWQETLRLQNGVCAIDGCDRPATDADHCHATGRRRGALCSNCNKALGLILDSPDRARGLASYLERSTDAGTDAREIPGYRSDGQSICVVMSRETGETSGVADRSIPL